MGWNLQGESVEECASLRPVPTGASQPMLCKVGGSVTRMISYAGKHKTIATLRQVSGRLAVRLLSLPEKRAPQTGIQSPSRDWETVN